MKGIVLSLPVGLREAIRFLVSCVVVCCVVLRKPKANYVDYSVVLCSRQVGYRMLRTMVQ
jgi:hypothetical protein